MKPTYIRRYHPRTSSPRENGMFKKENNMEHSFFGNASLSSFFKPAGMATQALSVQPKCDDCEKEDKVQKAEKGMEEEPIQRKGINDDEEKVQKQEAEEPEQEVMTFTPTFSERGVVEQNTRHFADCAGVTVEGFCDANYGNSMTAPGTSSPAKDCDGCADAECVSNTGTVVSKFTANPAITLPPVPDGLNECEQKAVQKFINTTLNAHEQQHVAAFNTYRGTVKTPYTYKGCASGLEAHTQQIHENIESSRKTKSDKTSAALDANGANIFNVTCECPDPKPEEGNQKK